MPANRLPDAQDRHTRHILQMLDVFLYRPEEPNTPYNSGDITKTLQSMPH